MCAAERRWNPVTEDAQREQVSQLQAFGSATVYEALGRIGAMDHAIKPLHVDHSVAGRAVTVDSAPGDNLAIHHAAALAGRGDVLVVDAKAFPGAGPWGDVLSHYAMHQGIAGLVISYEFEIAAGASVALCAVALSSLGLLKPKLGMP